LSLRRVATFPPIDAVPNPERLNLGLKLAQLFPDLLHVGGHFGADGEQRLP
jgi:hypothetical protein